jgi:DNA-binding XRE family transcriptional regulator
MSFWVQGNLTNEDAGEMIKIIRTTYLKINQDSLANKIGVKTSLIQMAENGRGAHVLTTLVKIIETFNLESEVTIKQMPNVYLHQ